VFASTFGNF
jgi:hypothetical protein